MIMDRKDIFYKDMEDCRISFSHIADNVTNPALREIDELYGAADTLSIQNAQKHRKILLGLAIVGTLLTIAFLLYSAAALYGLILACVVFIVFLYIIHKMANRMDCHRKYLEYRVLAETLRVQFFLSVSGIDKYVADILPWFIRMDIPWIEEMLSALPKVKTGERKSVLDCWIRDQKAYHENALIRSEAKKHRDDRITRIVIIVTLFSYVFAVLFELFVYSSSSVDFNTGLVRMILKIVLGTMSAVSLFTGSYYGKMSLSNRIGDHRRMVALYEKVECDVLQNGESEELLIFLAREFLIENSTWYAYQNKNKPDLMI